MSDGIKPEPAAWPFDVDEFWREHTTDEVFAGVKPWTGEESFQIDDLTEDESAAFWAAINE